MASTIAALGPKNTQPATAAGTREIMTISIILAVEALELLWGDGETNNPFKLNQSFSIMYNITYEVSLLSQADLFPQEDGVRDKRMNSSRSSCRE